MPRALYLCALSASLLAPMATRANGPAAAGQPPAPAAAPGPQPSTTGAPPAGTTIDPSLLQEARSLIPPPLRYGRFRPEVGTFVEYEVGSKRSKTRMRAAVVGRTVRSDGQPMYQVEFDSPDTKPRTLVVLWIVGDERPLVERLAVAVPPQAPVSIPVDLYLDLPELRGPQTREAETQVKSGPFAGKATQRSYEVDKGVTAEVVTSDKVPLFSVVTVRDAEGTWVARKTGTGATPELTTIPFSIPRLPRVK